MVKYQASQRETKGLPLAAASGGASGSDKRRK